MVFFWVIERYVVKNPLNMTIKVEALQGGGFETDYLVGPANSSSNRKMVSRKFLLHSL